MSWSQSCRVIILIALCLVPNLLFYGNDVLWIVASIFIVEGVLGSGAGALGKLTFVDVPVLKLVFVLVEIFKTNCLFVICLRFILFGIALYSDHHVAVAWED